MNDDTNQRAEEGRSLRDGLSPSGSSPAVSPLRASIPSAFDQWKIARSIKHHLSTNLIFRSTGRDPKCSGFTFAEVPEWQLRQWLEIVERAASAIEAGTAETEGLGAKPESAVSEAETPNIQRETPHD